MDTMDDIEAGAVNDIAPSTTSMTQTASFVDTSTTSSPSHIRVDLQVTGMMCQRNCGTTVRNALLHCHDNDDLIVTADASFAESRAYVIFDTTFMTYEECVELAMDAVECVGFDATEIPNLQDYLQQLQQQGQQEDDQDDNESPVNASQDRLLPDDDISGDIVLHVGGMSCAVCTGRVEATLKAVNGVQTATVVLATQRAIVELNHEAQCQQVQQACIDAIQQAGYECHAVQKDLSLQDSAHEYERARLEELGAWKRLLVISIVLTVPLVILDQTNRKTNSDQPIRPLLIKEFFMFLLSTAVQFGVGHRFYKAAYKGVLHGTLGMDFLIVMGTTASYLYSVIVYVLQLVMYARSSNDDSSFAMRPTFATGAMLLTFVTLGKFLESFAKGKTASALQSLMELQPVSASRVLGNDSIDEHVDISALETQDVDVSELRVGDILRVLPGSRIPTDGRVIAISTSTSSSSKGLATGSQDASCAYIDESALSGEPFPVAKSIGDDVFGSTVNQLSVLVMQVTATGSSTVLSKIVRLMEDAQRNKAPIQAYADWIAGIFAPVVIFLSSLTLFGWLWFNSNVTAQERFFVAFMSAISVIVVACPCALGLATPTAVMVGTGVGAKQGLLIKGGAVLEHLHSIDTVIMDKTGTLTTGTAILGERVDFFEEQSDAVLDQLPSKVDKDNASLWLAACAESQSEHPLAKAVMNSAKSKWGGDVTFSQDGVRVENFRVVPGRGVECQIIKSGWGSRFVRVGSSDWAKAPVDDSDASETMSPNDRTGDQEVTELRLRGQIAVYLSITDGEGPNCRRRVVSVFGIVDPVSKEARSTVAALQNLGVDVWMCTGDHELTARAVAREIGIDDNNICAGVTPEGKADLVTRLQRERASQKRRGAPGKVAVVGDGINDAVALARADVGIAVGAGTQIAVEAADVVLVRSSLHDVVTAIHLSKVVYRRIIMNFIWAMSYNLMALPFAAGVLYPFTDYRLPPEFAGLMMAFSSVSVVTSSLLLRNYTRPKILETGELEGGHGVISAIGNAFSGKLPSRRNSDYEMVPTKHAHVEMV